MRHGYAEVRAGLELPGSLAARAEVGARLSERQALYGFGEWQDGHAAAGLGWRYAW